MEKNNASFSFYHKTLKINIDNIEYDISNIVPDEIWNIGGYPKSPQASWEIRGYLIKTLKNFIQEKTGTSLKDINIFECW